LDSKPGALPGKRHHPTPIESSPEPLFKSIKKKRNVKNLKLKTLSIISRIEDIENTLFTALILSDTVIIM
jgi:hypothetical protein